MIVGPTPIRDHYMWPAIAEPQFAAILAQGTPAFGVSLSNEYWAIKRAPPEIVRALAWRVQEWTISGGWGFNDNQYTDNTHGTLLGTIQVDNSFDVINPEPKLTFAKYHDNSLTSWDTPIVNEPRLLDENYGPLKSGVDRKYIHDFANLSTVGAAIGGLHSYGCSTLYNSLGSASPPMTSIVNGVTYDSFDPGDMVIFLFKDFGGLATFNAWRGADMLKFHPLGDGPSGPSGAPSPTAFDIFFTLASNNGGATDYGTLSTFDFVSGPSPLPPTPTPLPPNGVIVIDPVIEAAFNVPVIVGSSGYVNSIYPNSTPYTRNSQYCTVKLTATKFFEYCDSNGDPIYDATTGVQLRDPFG